MANQLTKQVMAAIVRRCEGYEPLPETQDYCSYGDVNVRNYNDKSYNNSKDAGITQREEALLSSVIHRQSETTGQSRGNVVAQKAPNFSKTGVVSLDALLRELKK